MACQHYWPSIMSSLKLYSQGANNTRRPQVIDKYPPNTHTHVCVSWGTFTRDEPCFYLPWIYCHYSADMMSRFHITSATIMSLLIYNFHCGLHVSQRQKILHKKTKHKTTANHRDADSHRTNIILWPLCLLKYGRSFTREILLYKLRTRLSHTGLKSQTSSTIITCNTSPVWTARLFSAASSPSDVAWAKTHCPVPG